MDVPVFNRVPLLRGDRGWSRRELAERVGVHYQTVGYLERGDYIPSLGVALRLARLFEVPLETIFSLDPMTTAQRQAYERNGGQANEI